MCSCIPRESELAKKNNGASVGRVIEGIRCDILVTMHSAMSDGSFTSFAKADPLPGSYDRYS